MKLNINTEQRNDNYNWINEHNQGLRVNNQLGFIYKVLRKTNCESTLLRQEDLDRFDLDMVDTLSNVLEMYYQDRYTEETEGKTREKMYKMMIDSLHRDMEAAIHRLWKIEHRTLLERIFNFDY